MSKAEVDAIIAAAGLGGDDAPIDTKDEGFIELVLKILGLMCDGQNTTLQVSRSVHTQDTLFIQMISPNLIPFLIIKPFHHFPHEDMIYFYYLLINFLPEILM